MTLTTRFHCPDCKRIVTGKKEWLDFFITWIAIVIVLALAVYLIILWQGITTITSQTQTLEVLPIMFDIFMLISPFLAYFLIPEKCPICNLKVSEAEQLEEVAEWERKKKNKENPSPPED